jgi:hypothetical protein
MQRRRAELSRGVFILVGVTVALSTGNRCSLTLSTDNPPTLTLPRKGEGAS